MANDLNRWQGIGRLGKEPETRFMPNGGGVTNLSIACGSSWKDKETGDKKESVEWVRCVAFGKLSEICQQYLKKGQPARFGARRQTGAGGSSGLRRRHPFLVESNHA